MPLDGTNFDIDQRDEVLDLLRRARERVARPGGWCRDALANGEAKCSVGWLRFLDHSLAGRSVKELFESLPDVWRDRNWTGHDWWQIVIWYNDAPSRTQAEIVALFDRAIAKREGEIK